MSNTSVGAVYQQIINDVIDASRTDFEDGGVEEGVLEELRKGWQEKLSSMKVAAFPWDPKPEPTPAVTNPPPAQAPAPPANSQSYTQAQLSPSQNAQSVQLPGTANQGANGVFIKPELGAKNEPVIKQEPGLQNGLAQQGGAAASIHAIQGFGQGGAVNNGQRLPPQGGVQPGQPRPQLTPQQYQQLQQQQRPPIGQNGLAQSQTDGAADGFEGVLMQKDGNGNSIELGRVDIDAMLHEKIASRAKQMEGGGLMLPLVQAQKHTSRAQKSTSGIAQFDGIDDDIKDEDAEHDEDAINSDLDDPDDDQDDDDDDDDNMGHIMLCMYDKVQRVKNKWKCTLKDGVLTVNGKEYVFHKATGEYEW
ncbi:putative transcription factor tfiia complex subunit protein [Phaeoacremonium minimum UCRPA7]|uniref:Transcription initiation factor IIA large subunit n=1 Tax=Phaeoacremonium minimum (strain UCR-PA7) TaxID=1286976 RepID=R8BGU6_PHAM7|nr:putative transcription factor tfiia complex subunit protein [Phaeoacremonium minimum UCRPA7]EON98565.1 putative transcription factor tfiia complex subunit protein [Phaeoacremonium minimum UCRPA7]